MKKKGFTLIELLVVISIIAMLLAILMPALGRVKEMAQRVVCGTNCKGIGTSLAIYAADYDGAYPVSGGGGGGGDTWNDTGEMIQNLWMGDPTNPYDWTLQADAMTVSSCLYLLIKEVDGDPAAFTCKSGDQKKFEGNNPSNLDLTQLFDFSGTGNVPVSIPQNHVSYAYHMPYGNATASPQPANDSRGSSFAVLADKNPWSDSGLIAKTNDPTNWENEVGALANDWDPSGSNTKAEKGIANSAAHKRDGQNVLFGDGHASFEKRTDVGVKNDNIYVFDRLPQGVSGRRGPVGEAAAGAGVPKHKGDSFLVNDSTR